MSTSNSNHIAVLGPIPRDEIITHKGEIYHRYGAALHTSIVLSHLVGDEGMVHQISAIRKCDVEPVGEILNAYKNINQKAISTVEDSGDIVQLHFLDQNNREERQLGAMCPLLPAHIAPYLDASVFVCVPITDYEIPLESLRFIKENSHAKIVFDAHGPTCTLLANGKRALKLWTDFERWLPYIDVLKMNLEESMCCFQGTDVNPIKDNTNKDHLAQLAYFSLNRGLEALVITLDDEGAVLFTLDKNGKLKSEEIPACSFGEVEDTTGCGDSFAGGLAYGIMNQGGDMKRAVQFANAAGAMRTLGNGFQVFEQLTEVKNTINSKRVRQEG